MSLNKKKNENDDYKLFNQAISSSSASKTSQIPTYDNKPAQVRQLPNYDTSRPAEYSQIPNYSTNANIGLRPASDNLQSRLSGFNIPSTPQNNQNAYSTQIQNILDAIQNRSPFTYNMNADPLYQQYAQQYQRQGNLAMRDTMGNTAALTGGYGSSYGTTAGSQAYDSYLQQLNDKVPELEQLAYQKYQNELSNNYNQLSALMGLEQNAYNEYADSRDFDYNKSQDTLAQQNYLSQFDYQKQQDALAQQNYSNQFTYQQQQDKQAQNNWQSEFDYGKSQDALSQQNYLDQFGYQKQQDTLAQQNYLKDFDYQKDKDQQAQNNYNNEQAYSRSIDSRNYNYQVRQDKQARQDAINQLMLETTNKQNQTAVEQSQKNIEKYSGIVDDMLKATTKDAVGNETSKYSINDIWDYLNGSGLTDDEITTVVNGNYELRKYIETLVGANNKAAMSGGTSHSMARSNF